MAAYPEAGVSRGEVLYTGRGFISPSIAQDPYLEAYCWLRATESTRLKRIEDKTPSQGLGHVLNIVQTKVDISTTSEPVKKSSLGERIDHGP